MRQFRSTSPAACPVPGAPSHRPAPALRRALATLALLAGLVATVPAPAARSDTTAAPGDPVLLTVIDGGGSVIARYDMAALQELPQRQVETTTIWTEGTQAFTGVPLSALMAEIGPDARAISATAINDYAVEIPRADWRTDAPVLAYLNHGAPMSVRDKGPLWIVYPYDSDADFRTETVYARSIWQLDRIRILE